MIKSLILPKAAGLPFGNGDVKHLTGTDANSAQAISFCTRNLAERDNILASVINQLIAEVNNKEQIIDVQIPRIQLSTGQTYVVSNVRIPNGFEARVLNAIVQSVPENEGRLEVLWSSTYGATTGTTLVSTLSEISGQTTFYPEGQIVVRVTNTGASSIVVYGDVHITIRPVAVLQGSILVPSIMPSGSGGSGVSGDSGFSGQSGFSGARGASGFSGASGISGANGTSGFSGFSGFSGAAGGSPTYAANNCEYHVVTPNAPFYTPGTLVAGPWDYSASPAQGTTTDIPCAEVVVRNGASGLVSLNVQNRTVFAGTLYIDLPATTDTPPSLHDWLTAETLLTATVNDPRDGGAVVNYPATVFATGTARRWGVFVPGTKAMPVSLTLTGQVVDTGL